jgi:hypothetical protein
MALLDLRSYGSNVAAVALFADRATSAAKQGADGGSWRRASGSGGCLDKQTADSVGGRQPSVVALSDQRHCALLVELSERANARA